MQDCWDHCNKVRYFLLFNSCIFHLLLNFIVANSFYRIFQHLYNVDFYGYIYRVELHASIPSLKGNRWNISILCENVFTVSFFLGGMPPDPPSCSMLCKAHLHQETGSFPFSINHPWLAISQELFIRDQPYKVSFHNCIT